MKRKAGMFVLSMTVFLLGWKLGATIAPTKLPAPVDVLTLVVTVATTPGPRGHTGLFHLRVTLGRVLAVVVVSLVISVVVGIAMGANRSIEAPVSNVLPVWLSLPNLVIVLMSMVLFQFSDLSIVVAVTALATPFGIVNIWKGVQDVDQNLVEMARVFDVDELAVWRRIYFPAVLPYLFASGRYLLGMIWKVVLLAEAFGISTGIGSIVRFWYNQGNVSYLLAYFSLFVVTVFIIEYGILAQLEQRAFAWRAD